MKKLFLGLMFLAVSLFGSDEDLVSKLFTEKVNKVLAVVKNKTMDKNHRNEEIVKIISPMFDFKLMAMLSLGKNAWRSLDDKKQDEFTALYVKRMKESYSSKIDSYTNEKIVIDNVKKTKSNRIELITSLVDKGKKTEVIYKLHKPNNQERGKEAWLVYDVEIIGVSVIKTDRSQFKEVLKTQSIEELMNKLRE